MILRFYAKCGEKGHPPPVVQWPGMKATGQLYQYVGRKYDPESRVHRAESSPVVVDTEDANPERRKNAQRIAKICARDYSLWPADAVTAAYCGKPFVELEQGEDGEWRQKAKAAPVKSQPKDGDK